MTIPNRLRFTGVLTKVENPTIKSPTGARGHKILLKKEKTKKVLSSLRGQGVNCNLDFSGHDPRRKIGVITSARMRGDSIHISGHLWDQDFPEVVQKICASEDILGFSYELSNAKVLDMRSEVWEIEPSAFVGAAILRKDKAANATTSFKILREETK